MRPNGDSVEPNPPLVLGAELAAAHARERERRTAGPGPSALAALRYPVRATFIDAPTFANDPLDETLRERLNAWSFLSPDAREAQRSQLSLDDLYTLLTFARRTMVLGLRSRDPIWPQAGLIALTLIEADRIDHRDLTWNAGLVAYALDQLTPDAPDRIRDAASAAAASSRQVLERFAKDPPQTLTDWGFAVVGAGDALSVVSVQHKGWDPTVDLIAIAKRVAAAIETERSYEAESIAIGTQIPPVWMQGGTEDSAALDVVAQGRATAHVRAKPRTADADDHLFLAFIAEFAHANEAEMVARSIKTATADFARLTVTDGAVAVAVIARSVMLGVPGLEDDLSLQRFARPLAAAIAH